MEEPQELMKLFKRSPYRSYKEFKNEIPKVIERLRHRQYGDQKKISEETGIPTSTLSRWAHKLEEDPSFDPLDTKYGEHLRIFTDDEENNISDFIVENFIIPGNYFTDEDFKEVAMIAWREKYLPLINDDDDDNAIRKKVKEFHCSAGFISDFKENHRFSSKKMHLRRRPGKRTDEEKDFMKEMKDIIRYEKPERILNCDECGWQLFPRGILSWGEKGEDTNAMSADMSDKTQITVLATVSFAKTKLPLMFIAEGQTEYVEDSQLGDVVHHWRAHTPSGWINEEVFSEYLMHIREYFTDDEPVHLLLDIYKAHLTKDVRTMADTLNIRLHFIPAGLTDMYQPLDRTIFGPFKAFSRKLFRERQELAYPVKRTKLEAVQDMIRAWEAIGSVHIENAWQIYTVEDEEEQLKLKKDHMKKKQIHGRRAKPKVQE